MISGCSCSLAFALALAPQCAAQNEGSIAALLEAIRARHGVPALGAAVIGAGEPHRIEVVGVKRLLAPERATHNDRWHWGSCGKAMTATVIARLVAAGTLRWDATLEQVFPERKDAMAPAFRAVTVRQLLDHRTGLPREESAGVRLLGVAERSLGAKEQRLALLERLLRAEPATPPGTQHVYSNAGYWIAGAVIERVCGTPWEEAIREHLFALLGMTSAGFGPPRATETHPAHCGHELVLGRVVACDPGVPRASYPAFYGPAGDVHATLGDFAKFIAFHLVEPSGPALLTAPAWRAMHTPVEGAEYACGFSIGSATWAQGPVLAHHGSSPRWHAFVQISPADRRAVIAVCNQGGEIGEAACIETCAALQRIATSHR